MQRQFIQIIIEICGWLYFVIWSLSFYGQVITLFKQKSALGMSSNYIFINLTGYVMYTVYNIYGYTKGNNSETGKVDTSDLMFSLHSVFVYSLTVGLFFYYPHKVQLSIWTKIYLAFQWAIFMFYGFQALQHQKSFKLKIFGFKTSLGYIQTLGYFKMFSTLLKHPPQIYHNFKRQSTKGWSIQGMMMDFLGGFFSLVALILQLYLNPKFHVNVAKLFLSIMSMIYDVTYMIQHFALYGEKSMQVQQKKHLITQKQIKINKKSRLSPQNIKKPKQILKEQQRQRLIKNSNEQTQDNKQQQYKQ